MKTFTVATVACAALLAASPVLGMQSFLAKIPNGSLFGKWLGHTTNDYTTFGNDFSASFEWTEHLCGLNSLSTTMTNGEALGDPCCTWKTGATPQTITAWKEGSNPSVKTVCASGGSGSTTPTVTTKAPAATTKAPATTTTAPAATTKAPAAATTAPSTPTTSAPTSSKTKTPSTKTPKPSKTSKTPKPSKTSKTPSNKCTKKPKRF